jgi:hypothetical protein
MPYKDPERKRQWEKEHREERNARRRKSTSNYSSEPPGIDPNSAQAPLTGMSVAIGGIMGFVFLLTAIILMWRFGSSADPAPGT